jgi:hypothetical protein
MKKEEIIKLKINEFIELEQNINDIKLLKSFNTKKLSKRKMWKWIKNNINQDNLCNIHSISKSMNLILIMEKKFTETNNYTHKEVINTLLECIQELRTDFINSLVYENINLKINNKILEKRLLIYEPEEENEIPF